MAISTKAPKHDMPWAVFTKTHVPRPRHNMISLFCGCGGLDLGFRQAGFDIVWANDIDPNACATYKKNIGGVVDVGDINTLGFEKHNGELDMLSACFPCQPYSNAGARRGDDDERTLHTVAVKATEHYRPTVAIFENVRGMLSVKHGNRFVIEKFCRSLSELNYDVFFTLLDASEHRVPQKRFRVFIVAVRKDRKTGKFAFPAPQSRDGLTLGDVLPGIKPTSRNQKEIVDLGPQASRLCALVPPGGNWKHVDGRRLPARLKKLKKQIDRYRAPAFYRRFANHEIAGTVTATFKPEMCGVMHPTKKRPLSVREVARIQSFPDWFVFEGASVSAKYKQIGNAVPPRLAYELASNISQVLQGKSPEGPSNFMDLDRFVKDASPLHVSDDGVFVSAAA